MVTTLHRVSGTTRSLSSEMTHMVLSMTMALVMIQRVFSVISPLQFTVERGRSNTVNARHLVVIMGLSSWGDDDRYPGSSSSSGGGRWSLEEEEPLWME